jgi:transcriptional regulator with XRE-family HTH domain
MPEDEFADRLVELRHAAGLTQVQLAERMRIHPSQLHRYEAGTAQPSLDALRRLCTALSVPADVLLFSDDARTLVDPPLRRAVERAIYLNPHEQAVLAEVIEAFAIAHTAKEQTYRRRGPLQRRKRKDE